jgi:hypothetical protein
MALQYALYILAARPALRSRRDRNGDMTIKTRVISIFVFLGYHKKSYENIKEDFNA